MGPFLSQPSLDAMIAALAARQHAVIGLDQLVALGLSASAIRKRAADGRLHRIHRTVYSLVPKSLLTRNGLYMAAVLTCGPRALLSHRSAAALLGLQREGWTKVEVTVPRRSHLRHTGIAAHRSVTLAPVDAIMLDHIPTTTVSRTLFDLAEVLPRRPVERAFDQAEYLQLLDLRAIQDQLSRNATRRGAKVVRSILEEHYIGSTLTRSEIEEAMLALSRAVGLPRPEINAWLDLGDGGPMIMPDFMWRAQRLIVEVDSKYHRTKQRYESDRRRDQRALVAGWRVIRTTENQIKRRPGELHATVATLLAQDPPTAGGSRAAGADREPRPR
jgi:predicted transcriptional regulator of viral defense system